MTHSAVPCYYYISFNFDNFEGTLSAWHKTLILGLDHPDIPAAFVSDVVFGDFGPARKEVQDASGSDNYNVELKIGEMKINGVAAETGDRLVMWGFSNSVEVNYWLDEDQLQKKKDDRDPVEAPRYFGLRTIGRYLGIQNFQTYFAWF